MNGVFTFPGDFADFYRELQEESLCQHKRVLNLHWSLLSFKKHSSSCHFTLHLEMLSRLESYRCHGLCLNFRAGAS